MNLRIVFLAFVLAAFPAAAKTETAERPMVLIATAMGAQSFGEIVILAVPLGDGSHYGFVLNRPTETPVSELFPGEEASKAVKARVSLGGPMLPNGLFALVRERGGANQALHPITPDLSVALDSDEVDRVIAQRPGDARFFIGLVGWGAGELASEVKAGAWTVIAPDANIVMNANPAALWERLAPLGLGHSA